MRAEISKVVVEHGGDVTIHATCRNELNDPKRASIHVWIETDGTINLHLSGMENPRGGNQMVIRTRII